MKKLLSVIIIASILLLINTQGKAQYTRSDFSKYWYIGVGGGPNIFFGDVKQYMYAPVDSPINEIKYGISGQLGIQFTPVFGLRGQALYGTLAGTNRDINRNFEAVLFEGNLSVDINLSNWWGGYRPDRTFSFYGVAGLGFTNYKTRLTDRKTGAVVSEEGYKDGFGLVGTKLTAVAPFGLGFDISLSHNLKLTIESGLHITNTDYLDDYTGVRLPVDMYIYTMGGLTYQFKGKRKAPSGGGSQPDFAEQDNPIDNQQEKPQEDDYEPLINPDKILKKPTEEKPEEDNNPIKITIPEDDPVEEDTEVVEEEIDVTPTGFYYSVQVCAQRTGPMNINYFRNKFNFNLSLDESVYNGYYIYTSGRFQSYNEAKQQRDMIRQYNKIPGAFVVAIENGQRLPKLP